VAKYEFPDLSAVARKKIIILFVCGSFV